MKRLIPIIMLLAVSLTARGFAFSAPAPTGQTLYYEIESDTSVWLVNPDWGSHPMPTGRLEIPATVDYDGGHFTVRVIAARAFRLCEGLTHVVVPEGVQAIGTLAFFSCTALDTIELPSTIDSIASEAFNNCGYYNKIVNWADSTALYIGDYLIRVRNSTPGVLAIRDGTLGIGGMALYNCHSLDEVSVPPSVRFVGALVFKDCIELDTVRMLGTTPPTLASSAFGEATGATVVVPCGSLAAYTSAANWSHVDIVESPCPDGIETTEASEATIVTTPDGIIVSGIAGRCITVSDMTGRRIAYITQAAITQHIALPYTGVYVVTIDGGKSHKIVYL